MVDTANIPAQVRPRVPLWDNARFITVTLVVVGHAIQRLTVDDNQALIVYLFIYAFHMPAFAIISGYFSKTGSPSRRQMTKVLTDILLPYLIMESIWSLVKFLVEGKRTFNPSEPSWTLWFLLALGLFRLILPYLALLRWPMLWAILLSVGVGYLINIDSTFSLSRAIGILPFFVLGWKARESGIVERWRLVTVVQWRVRAAAIVVLMLWLVAVWVNIDLFRAMDLKFWFFYDYSYVQLGGTQWWAGFMRLAAIALAIILSAAFFVLIPRSATWFTKCGQATMYIYLLHSFVLYPLRESGFLAQYSGTLWLVVVTIGAIFISFALSSQPVRRVFRPLIEPKPRWLFVDDDRRRQGESRVDPTGSRRDRQ